MEGFEKNQRGHGFFWKEGCVSKAQMLLSLCTVGTHGFWPCVSGDFSVAVVLAPSLLLQQRPETVAVAGEDAQRDVAL